MNVEADFAAALLSVTEVTTLAGNRVFDDTPGPDVERPYLTYHRARTPRDTDTLGGINSLQSVGFTVECVSRRAAPLRQILDGLERLSGSGHIRGCITWIAVKDRYRVPHSPSQSEAQPERQENLEFEVWFNRS
jgi:hypothetical protein